MRNCRVLNEGYSNPRLVVKKAYGCYLEDVNNNKFIDTSVGNGTHILGHSSPIVNDAIKNQISKGTLFTVSNDLACDVSELISLAYPTLESVVFCNSGSEATMRAARIARAYSGKDKVAIFSGAWHGGNELFMYDHDYNSSDYRATCKSSGVPGDFLNSVIVLPYNDDKAFEIIEYHRHDLAMVIIEPSQGSNPRDDMLDFLKNLRSVTHDNNILLCFDEIITGFRISYGGCQQYYDIEADIVTYGKTLGGGLPIGAVAGKKEIMDVAIGSDDKLPVFLGGTFSANPLVMQVTKTLLAHLYENKDVIYSYLSMEGERLKSKINQYCIDNGFDVQMIGIGSMLRFVHTSKPIRSRRERDCYENMSPSMHCFYEDVFVQKNIFINNNKILFLSMAHSREIVRQLYASFVDSIDRSSGSC